MKITWTKNYTMKTSSFNKLQGTHTDWLWRVTNQDSYTHFKK